MIQSVAAFIIDFDTAQDAEKLSLQLAAAESGSYSLIIFHVDNGNSTRVKLSAAQMQAGVRLIRNSENRGYAGGFASALQQCFALGETFDAYWLLNSDLEIESSAPHRLIQILDEQPTVGAVGPRVMKGRTAQIWGDRGVVSPLLGMTAMIPWSKTNILPKWSYIPGCSILLRRKAYDAVGGIPTRYRLYYEETELCVQMQKNGWNLWVEPSAVVYHSPNSLKNRIPARHYAFYFARNNLYFWKHNFNIPLVVQLPRMTFVIFKELVLPLRRASSPAIFFDRIKYIVMGWLDSFSFIKNRFTYFEKKYFKPK